MTRIAVLTLTRDRLEYTKHCFQRLTEYAGCPYDHYILDQGSTDGTVAWLERRTRAADHLADTTGTSVRDYFFPQPSNIGISRGMNLLLDEAVPRGYDLFVKFDNDCEVTQPGTLARIAELADDQWILGPQVEGLNDPPGGIETVQHKGAIVKVLGQIGGIFTCVPAWVYREFRYDENNPTWGMDDCQLSGWFQARGGRLGYIQDLHVNHYETTAGQWARYPAYFRQKMSEGLPAVPLPD